MFALSTVQSLLLFVLPTLACALFAMMLYELRMVRHLVNSRQDKLIREIANLKQRLGIEDTTIQREKEED